MRSAKILVFDDNYWADKSAKIICETVDNICELQGLCNIMLTGGRSAKLIYQKLSNSSFLEHNKINLYFSDERCISHDDYESNYNMVNNVLLASCKNKNISLYPIYGDVYDKQNESIRYESLLPNRIDVLLLSIGEDSHIASLFPYDKTLTENQKKVVPVIGPKKPFSRISITPVVINSAKRIFCFGQGAIKGKALAAVFTDKMDILSVPAKLALHGTWLMDYTAYQTMNQFLNK